MRIKSNLPVIFKNIIRMEDIIEEVILPDMQSYQLLYKSRQHIGTHPGKNICWISFSKLLDDSLHLAQLLTLFRITDGVHEVDDLIVVPRFIDLHLSFIFSSIIHKIIP